MTGAKDCDSFRQMSELIYQVSDRIEGIIDQAVDLNKKIVSKALPMRLEKDLKFDTLCKRICYNLVLSNIPMTKNEVAAVIKGRKSLLSDDILGLYEMYSRIYWQYYCSGKKIITSSIFSLQTKTLRRKMKRILSHQNNNLHPLATASLVYIMIYCEPLFTSQRKSLAGVVFWAVLSSSGFTGNELIVLEEQWQKDFKNYQYAFETAIKKENASLWIEYFVRSYIEAAKRTLGVLSEYSENSERRKFRQSEDLTTRQIGIVGLFTNDKGQVTNRLIQKSFKISQLTASRELSLLTSKDIIISHGKGRNTYYTKV